MKTFQITGDENRIYFQNLTRRSGEEELAEALETLNARGCKVGQKEMLGTDDIYKCSVDGKEFDVIFTGEESIIYSEDKEMVKKIIQIFE